jgi:DNA-binding CsgD family transcriptional regulator
VQSESAELSAVIGDIYDAAIDPTLWQQALASVCAFVGGSSAALYWHDSAAERSEALHLFNEDPVYTRLYFEKYLPLNPMFPAASFIDEGIVAASEDVMPHAEFVKTRFYKEWLVPQGIESALSVNLEKGIARTSMIAVRTTILPQNEMRRRLGLLVPHLQRAVAIGKLFDQKAETEFALTKTLDHVEAGVFLVGATGQIVFMNDMAKAMLGEGVLVNKVRNTLRAVSPVANRRLESVFRAAQDGDASFGVRGVAIPLTSKSQDPWFAHVLPLTSGRRKHAANDPKAVAAVFIRKTVPNALSPLEEIAKLYEMTAAEIRVFDALLKVRGVKAIADLLGLAQSTVKTHLHRLFRKTGTKRQSDLIKLVAGL